jgi:hypothetical protein
MPIVMKSAKSIFSVSGVMLLCGSALNTFAQSGASARLKKNLPGVYLTVERIGIEPDGSPSKRIWFRLRNNTRWRIRVEASGGNPLVEAAKLYYSTLDNKENIVDSRPCHVCSYLMIGSGKDVLFTIPYAAMDRAASLRISFSYEWERDLDVASGREARHYAYYYFENLADDLSLISKAKGLRRQN